MSRLAQLVERKTLNLVVVGSSPTVGVTFCIFLFGRVRCIAFFYDSATRRVFASIAQLAEHALSKRKVTSSILVGGFQCSYGLAWL